ncbi:hypothetical protein C0J52_27575 [Blattella germanica]|nr:hypothetical protein C0J52_27575 [Blattella germanica]
MQGGKLNKVKIEAIKEFYPLSEFKEYSPLTHANRRVLGGACLIQIHFIIKAFLAVILTTRIGGGIDVCAVDSSDALPPSPLLSANNLRSACQSLREIRAKCEQKPAYFAEKLSLHGEVPRKNASLSIAFHTDYSTYEVAKWCKFKNDEIKVSPEIESSHYLSKVKLTTECFEEKGTSTIDKSCGKPND